ncbi:MAG: hypothetical protein R2795_23175 [Saprospiraceae bacterium]
MWRGHQWFLCGLYMATATIHLTDEVATVWLQPVLDVLTIAIGKEVTTPLWVQLLSANGQPCTPRPPPSQAVNTKWICRSCPAGIYLLQVRSGAYTGTTTLMKQ